MEYFSIDGAWWMPEHVGDQVPGRLTFDADGIELTLQGALRPFKAPQGEIVGVSGPAWEVIPVVWGRTNDRRDVTLLDVGGANLRAPFDEVVETYRIGFALVGSHADDDAFVEARFEFDLLDAWTNPPSLRSPSDERASLHVDTTTHELARAEIDNGSVALVSGTRGVVGDASIHLDRATQFVATLDEPRRAKEVLDVVVRPLNDLMMIALGRPVRLTSLQLRHANADEREGAADAYFEAVQPARSGQSSRSAVAGFSAPTLLTGDEAGSRLASVITRWFEVRRQYRDAIVLLLGPMYAPFSYSEHRFASTFQAAEALHRSSKGFKSRELSKSDHRARVTAVVNALSCATIDAEIAEWVRRILESRNDKPLWKLIDDLVRATGRIGTSLNEADPDFARVVAGARTGVSHGGARTHLNGPCRYWYGDALRWIVRFHLILELGFSSDRVEDRVIRRASFQHTLKEISRCAHERNPRQRDP